MAAVLSKVDVGGDWKIEGIGDLNGDGREDLVWRGDGGAVAGWLSTGDGFDGLVLPVVTATTDWSVFI